MSDAPKGSDTGQEDDVHRKFREALDRKNKAHHSSQEHEDNKGKGPAVNKTVARREFRRKSGG